MKPNIINNIFGLLNITQVNHTSFSVKSNTSRFSPSPSNDLTETTRLIYQALTELNSSQQKLTTEDRFKHIDAFIPSLHYLAEATQPIYLDQTFPLPEELIQLANLQRRLYIEMARGYKSIVKMIISQPLTPETLETLNSAITGALESLGNVLLASYRIYAAPPRGAWKEIHQLYAFTERYLSPKTAKGIVKDTSCWDRVSTLYKAMLLLRLADPYRLSQEEIDKLTAQTLVWAQHCQLRPMTRFATGNHAFMVNLRSDSPPLFGELDKEGENAKLRAIDISVIVTSIRHYVANHCINSANETVRLSDASFGKLRYETLEQIINIWETPTQQRLFRRPSSHNVNVSVGINATHQFLPQQLNETYKPSTSALSWQPETSSKPLESVTLTKQNDPTDNKTLEHDDSANETHSCTVVNENEGGICMICKGSFAGPVRVGEIVGIFAPGTESTPEKNNVAVVRWIKTVNQNITLFGIEHLSPTPVTVYTQDESPAAAQDELSPCFLLPSGTTVDKPATIVTTSQHHNVGDFISLYYKGLKKRLLLTGKLPESQRFDQFTFAIANTNDNINTLTPAPEVSQTHKIMHTA